MKASVAAWHITMAQSSAPIPQLGHIITWARSQGVQIDGVEPVQIKGRGMGIRAQRNIKVFPPLVWPLIPLANYH